jgi:hypothetical protein
MNLKGKAALICKNIKEEDICKFDGYNYILSKLDQEYK